MPKPHRGRIQAQGGETEASESWAQDEPLTKEDGLALLDQLERRLSKAERQARKDQFASARRFIENVEGGLDALLGKTFLNRKRRPIQERRAATSGPGSTPSPPAKPPKRPNW
jgi:hypothetical protein